MAALRFAVYVKLMEEVSKQKNPASLLPFDLLLSMYDHIHMHYL